jgi:hypothetical protein
MAASIRVVWVVLIAKAGSRFLFVFYAQYLGVARSAL